MNSKTIYEKIQQKSKNVITCGSNRNNAYSQYLKTSVSYNNFKMGFYLAWDLSKRDGGIQEELLARYGYIVKSFDQQLLNQMRVKDFSVEKIEIGDGDKECDFAKRITKIEAEGILRNKLYHEFKDKKKEFDEAKTLFHSEILLAFSDQLITETDHKIHTQYIEVIKNNIQDELANIQEYYNNIRKRSNRNNSDTPGFGRMHNSRGRQMSRISQRGTDGSRRGTGGSRRGNYGGRRGTYGGRRGTYGGRRGYVWKHNDHNRTYNNRGRGNN